MARKQRKTKKSDKPAVVKPRQLPPEPRLVEAVTVGWTVSVSTVVLCELGAVLAHLLALANPGAPKVVVLRDLLIFAAAAIGVLSLVLLPIVYRVRTIKPPVGFTVFAATAAVAPIVTLVARAVNS
ncbi:MAG: hypothetical protein CMJ58_22300 [Planctomycetaceae bacterium]|nr:hypothetical protein [Planctomycetaceae bacterium]